MLQFLVESPWEKKLYRVEGEEILVGRSRAATIPLLDEGARKRCFEVHRRGEELSYSDLTGGSLFLNERPAAASGTLRVGDRLRVAASVITLLAILERSRAATSSLKGVGAAGIPSPGDSGSRSIHLDPASDEAFLAGGFRSILEILKRLTRERNEERLLEVVVDSAIDLTGAERGFLLVASGRSVMARVARTCDGHRIPPDEAKVSHSIVRRAMDTRRAVLLADAGGDEQWSGEESVAALALRSVLSVPLVEEDDVLGALYVEHRTKGSAFTRSHVRLLEAFADQAALAIHSFKLARSVHRRTAELEQKNREVERLNARLAGELDQAREDLESKQSELEFRYDYGQIVGKSRGIRDVLHLLDRVTDTRVPVFVEGESGTGKELVARALHFNGPRRRERFVSENCSAIPGTLLEKILFGHVKGAFTGADQDAPGLFEQANGGTLFLDEVGDMSPEMQAKILRVLQEGEIRRVGGKDVRKVDVRIVCATNRDIDELRDTGAFREDLYWRVVVVRIRIPPLRERLEDVPLLVDHFLDLYSKEIGCSRKPVEASALDLLCRYSWPGNVRELSNEIRRIAAIAERRITPDILSERIRNPPPAPPLEWTEGRTLKDVVEGVEKVLIARALERHEGNKTKAAEALGLSRLGLRNKIERYGITE